MVEPKTRATLVGVAALALLGLGTLTLFAKTLPTRLRAPFGLISSGPVSPASTSLESEELLTASKDTDRDGLPDLQELQVYKTSPFLEDSDSDGVLDKAEIDAGKDPNCPAGTDCRAGLGEFAGGREARNEEVAQSLYRSTIISKLAESGLPGLTDANAIRGFLRQSGISEEVLTQFDDTTLLQLYNESARQSPQGEAGRLPSNPSPAAIRELLLSSGMDKAILDKIDDTTLVRLYQESLSATQR